MRDFKFLNTKQHECCFHLHWQVMNCRNSKLPPEAGILGDEKFWKRAGSKKIDSYVII